MKIEARLEQILYLELRDFDVILEMNWLGMYKTQMNYFAMTITFQGQNGKKIIFRAERSLIPTFFILAMIASKMVRKGFEAYLAFV